MEKNVFIKKNIFNWMIEESQCPIDLIRNKFSFVKDIENGSGITINQAQKLANYLKIPFGFLFLNELPKNGNFYADFRTIDNKQNNSLSKDLKDVLIDMDYKKNWMNSYRKIIGDGEISHLNTISLFDEPKNSADNVRKLLNVDVDWFRKTDNKTTLQFLKNRIENLGFIVMSSGIVGQNTRRKLDINEFRGFALYDKYAPLIFINSADNSEAECFTLIHELVHLLSLREDDILSSSEKKIEQQINKITSEFLMPELLIKEKASKTILTVDEVHKLAVYFKVNDLAIAYRLFGLRFIDNETLTYFIDKSKNYSKQKKQSGGDYYATLRTRLSRSFTYAVIDSVNTNGITFIEGIRLLGVSRKNYYQVEMMMEVSK